MSVGPHLGLEVSLNLVLSKYQIHRGYHLDGLSENSLDAILMAYELGHKMVEIDVRLSLDHVVVLAHDSEIKGSRISSTSWVDLAEMGLSSLQQVLESLPKDLVLNVEIKSEDLKFFSLCQEVVRLIHFSSMENQVLISSFNAGCLWLCKILSPKLKLAMLQGNKGWPRRLEIYRHLLHLKAYDFLHLEHTMISESLIKTLSCFQVKVAAWTVNDFDRAQELFRWGVVSIITDRDFRES